MINIIIGFSHLTLDIKYVFANFMAYNVLIIELCLNFRLYSDFILSDFE